VALQEPFDKRKGKPTNQMKKSFKVKMSDGTEAVARKLSNKEVSDILSGKADILGIIGMTEESLMELIEKLPPRDISDMRM
jgi:hypothetical protein